MTTVTIHIEKEEDLALLQAWAKKMGITLSVKTSISSPGRSGKKIQKIIEGGADLSNLDAMLQHIREGRDDRKFV